MLDDNVERVFEAIDENGDGFISKQESFNEEELQPDWEIAESGEPRINKMILFEGFSNTVFQLLFLGYFSVKTVKTNRNSSTCKCN